jgi:hypothetical protein
MKKQNRLRASVILLSLLFTMAACQKQMDENTSPTLFGKWKVKNAVGESNLFGITNTTSYTGTLVDYFEFTTGYIWKSHFQNDDEQSSFTLVNNKITLTARDEFPNQMEVHTLTNQRLVLYAKAKVDSLPFPQCYQEMTIYLEK